MMVQENLVLSNELTRKGKELYLSVKSCCAEELIGDTVNQIKSNVGF